MRCAASEMFKGCGVLFAVVAGIGWIAMPVVAFARQVRGYLRAGAGVAMDVALRLVVILGLVFLVFFSPYRKTVVARGVVEFGDTRILRAECPGFVERIH